MKICFYAPFKPLDHPNPSGDLIIGRGLYDFLSGRGHRLKVASPLRCRWIYAKPWKWVDVFRQLRQCGKLVEQFSPDLWLTYHSYYKAPDVLGPHAAGRKDIPYVIFQGIYSTKRRRDIRTAPGFLLNRRALRKADHVFTNRLEDRLNLKRIISSGRITYIPPGIFPDAFRFDPDARMKLRARWRAGNVPVVVSAAMFRPDVKTQGLEWVIKTCGQLAGQGIDLLLAIAGDGRQKPFLKNTAEKYLPGKVIFSGRMARDEMYKFYSAGDLFVFPGIRESLGMVFLEAQSCGLPVVAFHNGGIPEVVRNGETGMLTPLLSQQPFSEAVKTLLLDPGLRRKMGRKAGIYVRKEHNLNDNYLGVDRILRKIVQGKRMKKSG